MVDTTTVISTAAALFPKSKVGLFSSYWGEVFDYCSIVTPSQIAMFLAQTGHECQWYTKFEENLNYSAQGLANTWPDRYAVDPDVKIKVPNDVAKAIQRKPITIANLTYANRNGNGNPESGDGYKYRGRGAIMTTGYANYLNVDRKLNLGGKLVTNPDILIQPAISLPAAGVFWKDNGLAKITSVLSVRKKINGGLIGLEEVEKIYNKAIKLLS